MARLAGGPADGWKRSIHPKDCKNAFRVLGCGAGQVEPVRQPGRAAGGAARTTGVPVAAGDWLYPGRPHRRARLTRLHRRRSGVAPGGVGQALPARIPLDLGSPRLLPPSTIAGEVQCPPFRRSVRFKG